MIPPDTLEAAHAALKAFSDRVPDHLREKLQYIVEVRDNTITLSDSRPKMGSPGERSSLEIARFVYNPGRATWKLMWCDRDDQWHAYKPLTAERNFQRLVDEVMADPTCIFFG